MQNLKNNKLTVPDGICRELIKFRGIRLLNRMYELVRKIWETERIRE